MELRRDDPAIWRFWSRAKDLAEPASDPAQLVEEAAEQQIRELILEEADRSLPFANALRIRLAPEITEADYRAMQQEIIDLLENLPARWNWYSEKRARFLSALIRIVEERCGGLLARGAYGEALGLSLFLRSELSYQDILTDLQSEKCAKEREELSRLFQGFWAKLLESCHGEERSFAVAMLDRYITDRYGWSSRSPLFPDMGRFLNERTSEEDRRAGRLLEVQWLRAQVKEEPEASETAHRDREKLAELYEKLEDRRSQCAVLVDDFCAWKPRSGKRYQEIRKICPPEEWPAYRVRMMQVAQDDPVLSCQLHSIEGHYELVMERVRALWAGKEDFDSLENQVAATIYAANDLLHGYITELGPVYQRYVNEVFGDSVKGKLSIRHMVYEFIEEETKRIDEEKKREAETEKDSNSSPAGEEGLSGDSKGGKA